MHLSVRVSLLNLCIFVYFELIHMSFMLKTCLTVA